MANPQLTVEITAKIDGLRDSFNKAVSEIKGLDGKTKSSLSSIDKSFGKLANDVEKSMGGIVNSTKSASNSISQSLAKSAQASASSGTAIAKGSNQAAFALTNLGRVAQDAPFGFIGIQNNLNTLLESFQRLKAETGSASSAFKALASGLTGAGGIGLALSVVSSLYLVYTEYSRKASKADEEKAKNTKSAKEALDEYIKTLSASNQALVKGQQDAQKEIITLNQLYFASRNLQLPLAERIKAAKALQEQYPQTFKNFTAEQIALGKASTAYQQLSVDIIAVAKAAARTDLLVANEKEILQLRLKKELLEKSLKTQKEAEDRAIKTSNKTISNVGGAGFAESNQGLRDLKLSADEQSKSLSLQQQIKTLGNDIAVKRRESLGIEKEITAEQVKQQSVVSITGIDTTKLKEVKETIKQGYQLAKSFQGGIKLGDLGNPTAQVFDPKPVIAFTNSLAQLRNEYGFSDEALANFVNISSLSFDQLLSITQQFSDSFKTLIEGSIVTTIGNLGTAIGEAIASGGNILEASGKALLQGFGNFLSGYGDLLIKYGAAAIIKSKLDAAALIPGAGLIVGPLAIAAGIALKIAGSALSSFASKGGSGGSSSGGSGSSRRFGSSVPVPEPMSNSKYSGTSVTPSGTISSIKDMVPYGASNQTIIPEVRIGNDAIYIAYKRGEKQQSRV